MKLDRFYPIFDHPDWLERMLPLGVKLVQMRIKDLPADETRAALQRSKQLCDAAGAIMVVNDFWEMAIDLDCDWIHLGQEDLDDADMAAIRRAGLKIGISTHDEDELDRALAEQPDYVALGPVYPTILKKMKWVEQGLDRVQQWKNHIGDLPLVGIGGMTIDRAAGVYAAGADIVSVVTDITLNENPEDRLKELGKGNKMNRYDRQISVAEFGVDGQKKLAAAKILVVGAGGLASPVLQYLAGAGLGHIKVMDYDIVSVNNMHRQTIFRTDDLGLAKAGAAATNMRGLNPDCQMTPIIEPLTPDNIETHASDVDLVLDCADSFAVSYSLSDYCLNRLPLIHASVVGTAGYVGGFCYNAPSLRAVFPDLPQRFGSCAEDGVLGPIVGIIGSLQAQMTLAVITKQLSSPLGQLVTYDAIGNRFGGFRFDGVEEPDARWHLSARCN